MFDLTYGLTLSKFLPSFVVNLDGILSRLWLVGTLLCIHSLFVYRNVLGLLVA